MKSGLTAEQVEALQETCSTVACAVSKLLLDEERFGWLVADIDTQRAVADGRTEAAKAVLRTLLPESVLEEVERVIHNVIIPQAHDDAMIFVAHVMTAAIHRNEGLAEKRLAADQGQVLEYLFTRIRAVLAEGDGDATANNTVVMLLRLIVEIEAEHETLRVLKYVDKRGAALGAQGSMDALTDGLHRKPVKEWQ